MNLIMYYNTSMYKDKNGNIFRCSIDDPKVLSGEYVGVTKGNKLSEEHNKKIHEKHKGRIHINNGNEMKYVYKYELNTYIENGWKIGGLPQTMSEETKNNMKNKLSKMFKGRIHITKDKHNKLIDKNELEYYLSLGWIKGQYKEHINKISTLNTKWMNNGIIHKNVPNEQIQEYLNNGWKFGMLKRKNN